MKYLYTLALSKKQILFVILYIFISFQANSQDKKEDEKIEPQKTSHVITIDKISDETEKIGNRIVSIKEILNPNLKISKVDSILKIIVLELNSKKDSIISLVENMNQRDLSSKKIEWNNYRTKLKEYQNLVKDRTKEISDINDEMVEELIKWQETRKELEKNATSGDIFSSLDDVISTIQEVINVAHERLDNTFIIQKNLTEMVLTIDLMVSEFDRVLIQIQKNYFAFDSKPIWLSQQLDSIKVDSPETQNQIETLSSGFDMSENKRQIKEFYYLNAKNAVFQVVFVLLILSLLIVVGKRWKTDINDINNSIEREAKIVLSNPILSSLVIGLLVSVFFYDALIPILGEIHLFLVFGATVILLPKLTQKIFLRVLTLLFITYILQFYNSHLETGIFKRWMLILEGLLLVFSLIYSIKIVRNSPNNYGRITRFFRSVIPFYVFASCIAIIANIIGMVGLAEFLTKGILFSTILGLVVYLAVKIITSISILFFKLRKSYNLQTLTTMVQATNDRIQPILFWTGLIVWIYFSLKAFELYQFIINWMEETLTIEWNIGEMTISLGGILAFSGIFIFTMILAKLIAAICQDEWMVKVLPRGIAPAISLILRIVIVTIGMWVGLSAAGLDLSKLGIIIGALGVGIGFGLQNVVLNFIAGLILAFERPINLGDAIEIDQEFGIVTSIGIRSSNIKTWDGKEAIIPNGDLISKKVINWTLNNRNRRSKILLKTSPNADPQKAIELFNRIASNHEKTFEDPAPKTYFKSYGEDGNLQFQLLYWTTFSDTLEVNHDIALNIFKALKDEGIQAPAPIRRIMKEE